MKKLIISLKLLLTTCVTSFGQTTTYYSWSSENGKIKESGGIATEHNCRNYMNMKKDAYYTIMLAGRRENIDTEDDTVISSYIKIQLEENTFHVGDQIKIEGFRYNSDNKAATIYFLFEGGATIIDTNNWRDLGKETTEIGGGITGNAKTRSGSGSFGEGDRLESPSTYTFTVPKEADGAHFMKMTRNLSYALLYITNIEIGKSDSGTIVKNIQENDNTIDKNSYNLTGQKIREDYHGIVIQNKKKVIKR